MRLTTRKLLDRAFSGLGFVSILVMAATLLVILVPIFKKGVTAVVFQETVEHRKLLLDKFNKGQRAVIEKEVADAAQARQPIYDRLSRYRDEEFNGPLNKLVETLAVGAKQDNPTGRFIKRRLRRIRNADSFEQKMKTIHRLPGELEQREAPEDIMQMLAPHFKTIKLMGEKFERYNELQEMLAELLGPMPGVIPSPLIRNQYGKTRWERATLALHEVLYVETWDYSDPSQQGKLVATPRKELFTGTVLEDLFDYLENHLDAMLKPRWTFYGGFFTDAPLDAHIFGGILPELIGTIYLTIGAILFAVPLGIIAAIYLTEYAADGRAVRLLRTCISTLAGVPSIVFGLFGLAFFINTLHVSRSKSVLAGSLTLGLLILPTIIRASEEAIRAVPQTYKEAALGLGAGRWHTVLTVILPAALPGILTGIVISMGRAAGETAPIIFTAAVSVGRLLKPWEAFSQATPALSWNIYNLCTEHEAVDEIRHVQFGMVAALVTVVLLLNLTAVILRARISKRLKG